jgi:hypothetical protein
MTRYEYDEEASERLHMDVVYEVDDSPGTQSQWAESMRRLNRIKKPLAAAFWHYTETVDLAAEPATPTRTFPRPGPKGATGAARRPRPSPSILESRSPRARRSRRRDASRSQTRSPSGS